MKKKYTDPKLQLVSKLSAASAYISMTGTPGTGTDITSGASATFSLPPSGPDLNCARICSCGGVAE